MRKCLSPCFFFLALLSTSLYSGEIISLASSLGAEVKLYSPSFAPGEIVTVKLENPSSVKKVAVRFRGDTYELGPAQGGLEAFAFIGIDLDLQPGRHVLDVIFFGQNGQMEFLKKEFLLSPGEFPVKKLRVREEFVTPPPETLERIAWEAELLHSVYSIVSTRWLGAGKFIVPHPGEMADNFGQKRIYNDVPRSLHSGVDISAPLGSPVAASNAGRVVLARDLYFSGKTVILDHGLGLFTTYGHFSRIKVKRGALVRKGDILGLAGSTGRSTGPHLHWGAKIQQTRVDPSALLNLPLQE